MGGQSPDRAPRHVYAARQLLFLDMVQVIFFYRTQCLESLEMADVAFSAWQELEIMSPSLLPALQSPRKKPTKYYPT